MSHEMNRVQSKYHNIGTYKTIKVSLFCNNYKKCI